MASLPEAVIGRAGLDELLSVLQGRGYRLMGPVVRDGSVVTGTITDSSDLPVGYHDDQQPGRYRLRQEHDGRLFGWAVGPQSWKAEVLAPRAVIWRGRVAGDEVTLEEEHDDAGPVAMVGARPCDLAALRVLDGVLGRSSRPDPSYRKRRSGSFVIAVECDSPSDSCFCTSMGGGPEAEEGFDLCLTELDGQGGHRFLARAGSAAGAEALGQVGAVAAAERSDRAARAEVLARARSEIRRRLDTDDLAGLLARNQENPRWGQVAERCLACGNCTQVCPTCFCTSVEDTSDLRGGLARSRRWASCFELAHSLIHGGPVRISVRARYRQWLTHKLSTWHQQFGSSGCVGCGRCITWCPVGIDLTEEVAAIRASDGATVAGFAALPDRTRP